MLYITICTHYVATLHNENHKCKIFAKIFLGRRKNQQSKTKLFYSVETLTVSHQAPAPTFLMDMHEKLNLKIHTH